MPSRRSSIPISRSVKAPRKISLPPTGGWASTRSRRRSMAPLDALALAIEPDKGTRAEAAALNARYGDLEARDVVALALDELFPGRIALVSSFGAESAVLLHMIAAADRDAPVIFLDTGRLFAETLEYRRQLTE